MRHLPLDQGIGDHADNLAASGLRRIRESPPKSNRCTAIDQADPALGQKRSQFGSDGKIRGIAPGAGTAEDAKTVHMCRLFRVTLGRELPIVAGIV